jgi:16S rRNA (uracil1498-N3)-methyltransferase
MSRYDFRTPRLHVDAPLHEAAEVPLDSGQVNHLVNVLRLKSGNSVLVFNGRDGEWQGTLAVIGKRGLRLVVGARSRAPARGPDLHYCFAPLKHGRLDYMVQKAVEMGASRLQPVITRHVQASRVNLDRMRANAIEAAQQCGLLTVPEIRPVMNLDQMIAEQEPDRLLVFCDEDAPVKDPIAALSARHPDNPARPLPLAVLIGPEGGFADDERAALNRLANAVRLSLGPRILRADTAAVAALALVGAVLGDWR